LRSGVKERLNVVDYEDLIPDQLTKLKAWLAEHTDIPDRPKAVMPPDIRAEWEEWLRFLGSMHGQRESAKLAAIRRAQAAGISLTREQVLVVLGYETWELPERPSGMHGMTLGDILSIKDKIRGATIGKIKPSAKLPVQAIQRIVPSLKSILFRIKIGGR